MENRLIELKKEILFCEKQKSKLDDLVKRNDELVGLIEAQRKRWEKEQRDVDKLENGSLTSFFLQIIGNLDKKIEKEEIEALKAKEIYESTKHEIESTKKQILAMKDQVDKLYDLNKEYNILWIQKEEKLLKSNTSTKEQYEKYIDKIASLKSIDKELKEAVDAGKILLKELYKAKEKFESAHSWGVFDMFGGGLMSSMIKHDHINEANDIINNVKSLIKKFERELKDVDIEIDVNITTFDKFGDIFFDNIFSDMMVQDKINNVLGQVKSGILCVENKVKDLEKAILNNKIEIDVLDEKRVSLVEMV
ncbi:hypothetical protein [Tepidibacter hydrothermalis]|uniref:Uncharacterized protein n=1 Tax=Tepidibacter hydrothermalis TaxID=3036126 RepID=A0ABY8EAB7_9FIRM|nr:hypothetical protein [Tepidibacter hydrothermalis]WFD09872.1 hypothetical protein P4S50_16005 [Tepidibacter hydrothermalis]